MARLLALAMVGRPMAARARAIANANRVAAPVAYTSVTRHRTVRPFRPVFGFAARRVLIAGNLLVFGLWLAALVDADFGTIADLHASWRTGHRTVRPRAPCAPFTTSHTGITLAVLGAGWERWVRRLGMADHGAFTVLNALAAEALTGGPWSPCTYLTARLLVAGTCASLEMIIVVTGAIYMAYAGLRAIAAWQ